MQQYQVIKAFVTDGVQHRVGSVLRLDDKHARFLLLGGFVCRKG